MSGPDLRDRLETPDAGMLLGETSGQRKSSTVRAVEVLSLAFLFPIAVYAGFRLGGWLGGMVGVPSLGSLVGGGLGAAAGFWELLRRVRIESDA